MKKEGGREGWLEDGVKGGELSVGCVICRGSYLKGVLSVCPKQECSSY